MSTLVLSPVTHPIALTKKPFVTNSLNTKNDSNINSISQDTFRNSNKEKAISTLSKYDNVRDLILGNKQQKDFPELKTVLLQAKDLDENPIVSINIYKALSEKFALESNKTGSTDVDKSESLACMSDAFGGAAASLAKEKPKKGLKFGVKEYYNGKSFATRFADANRIIHGFSTGAGITGTLLSPIPLAGPAALTMITYGMVNKFGKDIYNKDIALGVGGFGCLMGSLLGPHLANQIWNAIPGLGPLILAVSEGASAGAMHELMGWSLFSMFEIQLDMNKEPEFPKTLAVLGTVIGHTRGLINGLGNHDMNLQGERDLINDLRRTIQGV